MLLISPRTSFGNCNHGGGMGELLIALPIDKNNYAGTFHCTATYDGLESIPADKEFLPVKLYNHNAIVSGFTSGELSISMKVLNSVFFSYLPDLSYPPNEESIVCLTKEQDGNRLVDQLPYYDKVQVTCALGTGSHRAPVAVDTHWPDWLDKNHPFIRSDINKKHDL